MKKINKIGNFMSDSKQEVLNIRNFLPLEIENFQLIQFLRIEDVQKRNI